MKYKLFDINDQVTVCQVCGRRELKKVFWLRGEDGSEMAVGSNCGAELLGVPSAKVPQFIKSFNSARDLAATKAEFNDPAFIRREQILKAWEAAGLNYQQRLSSPEIGEYRDCICRLNAVKVNAVSNFEMETDKWNL